ncbi:GNAT family N-acetyltransferase [Flavobacterium nackdongense]|uniref:GNAT family N-acetyltransferase n=1 Tax=Flavobacterium nackdongense TaxID=2547394 RepID=A0A4P6YGD4_9FLAO|nr:GNAT family N-acetyltransferase [Flavobacterium nackdongense]QBN19877.1 GNAT family N-acetyltransferase [Flavobacterium nackdongense]
MIIREATIKDWDKLLVFFQNIYRPNHPLHCKEFWKWQYGDEKFGRSFICLDDTEQVVAHVGASFENDLAWLMNLYVSKEHEGKRIPSKLYDLARQYYPLVTTAANKAALDMYQSMRWIRYHNLVRYVKINPIITDVNIENVCKSTSVNVQDYLAQDIHYFQQPTIKGLLFKDGSRAVSQEEVGGLRVLDIGNSRELESEAWRLGFLWMDYTTSWNDTKTRKLEKNGWVLDYKSVVPWRLNPVEENCFCDVSFLSEEPIDKELIVKRSHSDHGRIGSINKV